METLDSLFGLSMINHGVTQVIAMGLCIFLIPKLWVSNIFGAIVIVLGVSLINAFLWDAALFYSIPRSVSVTAIQLFLANGLLFWALVKLLPGIEVDGFLPAIIAPVVFSITSEALNRYAANIDWVALIFMIFAYIIELKDSLLNGPKNI